ncbi:MAG: hypothetical protein LAT76_03375 [Schleiferiaceae bacterium]|nr:hypothetical protein [Schleiferiaceae bacterium]
MTDTPIVITKQTGEKEPFDANKLRRSLEKAQAPADCINDIVSQVADSLTHGMSTRKIYRLAYRLLRKRAGNFALRYKLKEALLQLGPTGYPFEIFVGEIFSRLGYAVEVGVMVKGACISHEMDVIATKGSEQLLIECKFARDQKSKQGIQTALYVHARVQDIIAYRQKQEAFHGVAFQAAVFTNAQLTLDTITYGKCQNMRVVGWDYPATGGLRDLVEQTKIFPITILEQLTKKQQQHLLEKGIVSCRDLERNVAVIDGFHLTKRKVKLLQNELKSLRSSG